MIVETVVAVGKVEGIERWCLKLEEGKAAGRVAECMAQACREFPPVIRILLMLCIIFFLCQFLFRC